MSDLPIARRIVRSAAVDALFSPDTVLRRCRRLEAETWDDCNRRRPVGRSRVRPEIVEVALRGAR